MNWKNYLVRVGEGAEEEQILVGARCEAEVYTICDEEGFTCPEILDTLTDEEAEASGLDEF